MQTTKQMFDEGFDPRMPGREIAHLFLNYRGRYYSLSSIPRTPGWCKWCRGHKTPSLRHQYCSKECNVSAEMFCYPQRTYARIYLEKRQEGRCAHCRCAFDGYDYREVDHIIPICKGGEALGWWNTQMLCGKCHTIKTKEDMK